MEFNKTNYFNKISYNKYKNISKFLWLSSCGLYVADNILPSQISSLGLDNSLIMLELSTLLSYIYMELSNNKYQTKEFIEIKSLYQEFLSNYNKLNNDFNFDDVIQIYTMFYYLLNNGYLSKDKIFTYNNEKSKNIKSLNGINIFSGNGVCRHIAPMLTDILNYNQINAYNLACIIRNSQVEINYLKEEKYSKEELIDWILKNSHSFELENKLKLLLDTAYQNNIYLEFKRIFDEEKNIIEKNWSNNVIVFAKKDNNSYFLDPTNQIIYRTSEDDKNILYDANYNYQVTLKNKDSILISTYKDYKRLNSELEKDMTFISLDEENEMIKSTLNICNLNLDLFENFYNTNKELYNELSNKFQKIKKKL